MHFHGFYYDNILCMFRIGKLVIFRRQFYCTCSLWYVILSCIHMDLLLPRSRWNSTVVVASPHECMIRTVNCMNSKIASWRWIACLFRTIRGCYQNKIHESASRWVYYTIYHDTGQYNIKNCCRRQVILTIAVNATTTYLCLFEDYQAQSSTQYSAYLIGNLPWKFSCRFNFLQCVSETITFYEWELYIHNPLTSEWPIN